MEFLKAGQRPKAFTSAEVWDFVLKPQKYPQQIRVLVTPELATALLAKMRNIRHLRKGHVAGLSLQLKDDLWQLIHGGIAIDTSGAAYDAQHRLAAIIETGIPAELFIAVGMSTTADIVTDANLPRSLADYLEADGHKNANHLSGVIRLLWWYDKTSNGGTAEPPTIKQALEYFHARPELEECTTRGIAVSQRDDCDARTSALAVLSYLCLENNGGLDGLTAFLDGLSGIGLERGSPTARLKAIFRNSVRANDAGKFRSLLDNKEMLAYCIIAWNAQLQGQTTKRISWGRGEEVPKFVGRKKP